MIHAERCLLFDRDRSDSTLQSQNPVSVGVVRCHNRSSGICRSKDPRLYLHLTLTARASRPGRLSVGITEVKTFVRWRGSRLPSKIFMHSREKSPLTGQQYLQTSVPTTPFQQLSDCWLRERSFTPELGPPNSLIAVPAIVRCGASRTTRGTSNFPRADHRAERVARWLPA